MSKKQINLTAPMRFLSLTLFTILFLFSTGEAATQIDIAGPVGSEQFGEKTVVLPNGNIVVTDPLYDAPGPVADVGAVYLYNGATGALINTLTGSAPGDKVGAPYSFLSNSVFVLSNGDFVIASPHWNNGAGAVTLCSASTGCSGTVSGANSLVGSIAGDFVGHDKVQPLPNGNYVVISPSWDNGAVTEAGAITFCSGTTGCSGAVSAMNSLVGSKTNDIFGELTVLTNGDYVVSNASWDNGTTEDVGAVTLCSGTTGCAGVISTANSLVGTQEDDRVGFLVTALTNGNYVVASSGWSNGTFRNAGAVTFCSGETGCTGAVSPANSLVGTRELDIVGMQVIALTNGNYVVASPHWDSYDGGPLNPIDSGAVTFCSGTTGCTGTITQFNSLLGLNVQDQLGSGAAYGVHNGVVALPNGNYVISSPYCDYSLIRDGGLVTFCNGTTGCLGGATVENSLRGSRPYDYIGFGGITPLPNGDYVVQSPYFDSAMWNDVGAATRCSGTTGCITTVSSANSLVGSQFDDKVGESVTALTNGNYVVAAPSWNKGLTQEVGAVTLCSGAAPCTGEVTTANSLTGAKFMDRVGEKITALTNGNFVVTSPDWDNGATLNVGAVTWCSGLSGCPSAVSSSNSLVGLLANDSVGDGGTTALAGGNYIVRSNDLNNDVITKAGAGTLGAGYAPTVSVPSFNNSVRGNTANSGDKLVSSYDAVNERLVVGRPADNKVSLFRPTYTAVASGNWSAASTWDYGAFQKPQNTVIRSPHNVTLDTNIIAASVFIFPSAGLTLSGDRSSASGITLYGTLDLNSNTLDLGDNQLNMPCSAQPPMILDANASGYIIGKLSRCLQTGSTTMEFPVGTANGYSPVTLTNVSGGGANATFRVKAVQGAYSNPANGLPSNRLGRWWELTNGGLTQADVQFNYLASDVTGNESNYRLYKIAGEMATQQTATIDMTNHTATVLGVTNFSDWTLADAIPTAASVSVGGRVLSAAGFGISKATVTLTDNEGNTRTVLTNGFGYYKFEDVAVGETYIFSISSKQHQFTPQVVMVTDDIYNLNFAPVSNQKQGRIVENGLTENNNFKQK